MRAKDFIFVMIMLGCIFVMASFTSCTGMVKIPDFRAHITLPASEDGYWVKTVSPDEGRIPKLEWAEKRKHGIIILREDWAILRDVLLENCLTNSQCTDVIGTFDGLFQAVDDALKKVPLP